MVCPPRHPALRSPEAFLDENLHRAQSPSAALEEVLLGSFRREANCQGLVVVKGLPPGADELESRVHIFGDRFGGDTSDLPQGAHAQKRG